jgi:hypothetical protein
MKLPVFSGSYRNDFRRIRFLINLLYQDGGNLDPKGDVALDGRINILVQQIFRQIIFYMPLTKILKKLSPFRKVILVRAKDILI